MEITETLYVPTRREWREWLAEHHTSKDQIWLVGYLKASGQPSVPYPDAVEEALCFGWIDSIRKKLDADRFAQRYTPRRTGSGYSQTNKERLAMMIEEGRVNESVLGGLDGFAVDYHFPDDILDALRSNATAWQHFQSFSPAYRRIRVAYVDSARSRGAEFNKRLEHLVRKTEAGRQFGYGIERFYGRPGT